MGGVIFVYMILKRYIIELKSIYIYVLEIVVIGHLTIKLFQVQ